MSDQALLAKLVAAVASPTLTRWLPYREYQHEVIRWLEVVGLAGAPPVSVTPRIDVTADDLDKARSVLPESELPSSLYARRICFRIRRKAQ